MRKKWGGKVGLKSICWWRNTFVGHAHMEINAFSRISAHMFGSEERRFDPVPFLPPLIVIDI
jgi:hypothetical protein